MTDLADRIDLVAKKLEQGADVDKMPKLLGWAAKELKDIAASIRKNPAVSAEATAPPIAAMKE